MNPCLAAAGRLSFSVREASLELPLGGMNTCIFEASSSCYRSIRAPTLTRFQTFMTAILWLHGFSVREAMPPCLRGLLTLTMHTLICDLLPTPRPCRCACTRSCVARSRATSTSRVAGYHLCCASLLDISDVMPSGWSPTRASLLMMHECLRAENAPAFHPFAVVTCAKDVACRWSVPCARIR